MLCEVLVHFPTKDVVKSSVLSRRWRNLWKSVPRLALGYGDFPEYKAFVSFVDSFLGFDSDSYLREFRLKSESLVLKFELDWKRGEPDVAHVSSWIDSVLKRRVEHLHVLERKWHWDRNMKIPLSVYTCKSLVTLKLRDATLPNPTFVSLPRVKVMKLDAIVFTNDLAFEMLISGCPCLLGLYVKKCPYGNVKVFRVCSQSLLSFTLVGHNDYEMEEDIDVAIDAPRLEYLFLVQDQTNRYLINNLGSLVKVDIDTIFNLSYEDRDMLDPNDVPKRDTIRNFLIGISSVRDMVISSDTLEIIYDFSRYEPIPLLPNLSSLHAEFEDHRWEMLPIFLESCPNLKSLTLEFSKFHGEQAINILPGPHSFLPSLESVEIEKPMIDDVEAFMKLASYFLEKSTILKDFIFCLGDLSKEEESAILKKLLAIPRLSSSCQVMVL